MEREIFCQICVRNAKNKPESPNLLEKLVYTKFGIDKKQTPSILCISSPGWVISWQTAMTPICFRRGGHDPVCLYGDSRA